MMKVQIQYFEGCPHWKVAEDRLRAALEIAGEPVTVERCPVETLEDAERLQFRLFGPDTIREWARTKPRRRRHR